MCTKYIWIRIRKHIVETPWSFSLLLPKSNDAESSTCKHSVKKTSLKKKNTNNLKKPKHFLKTEVLINVIVTDNLYHKDLPFSWSTQVTWLVDCKIIEYQYSAVISLCPLFTHITLPTTPAPNQVTHRISLCISIKRLTAYSTD